MPQLHFYVPDDIAREIRRRAEQLHLPVSRYLVSLIRQEIRAEWPETYFEDTYGGWEGDPLIRESEGKLEKRLEF